MEELTISQVAQRAGIRTSAIRYYESVNILPTPRRINGRRRYDASILDRLSFIQIAQQAGFTVAEMQVIFNGLGDTPLSQRWQTLAHKKLAEVDALINRAHGMKRLLEEGLRCGCLDLADCIDCVVANCQSPNNN
ncbi:MAG: MerR family transcriptional regulator [Chloroflexi bacterium]|nr:MerR family transcriptional regulator [Chloroflexota bacterium]